MAKELTPTEKALERKKIAVGGCVTQVINNLESAQESLFDVILYSDKENMPNVEVLYNEIGVLILNTRAAFRTSLDALKQQEENMPYVGNGVSYQQKNRV